MDFNAFWLVTSALGGFVGAAIGGLLAFIFTGLMVLLGVLALIADPESTMLSFVAFGPIFGPHVGFAAGVAALAYARKRGYDIDGKDIVTPLVKLARPDVLLVGALFGMFGYVVNQAVAALPWFGSNSDTIAFTVVISGLVTRLLFGSTGLLGAIPAGSGWSRFAPNETFSWVRYQERFGQATVLGLFVGGFGAALTVGLLLAFPATAGSAHTFAFGLSAFSLLFLSLGLAVPVTHHITLPAGLAAFTFLPLVGENPTLAVLIGALFGLVGAWLGEFFARLWHIHGDTHIDPPASAIWPATTLILVGAALVA